MKKVLVITSSEVLGMPAIATLKQQGMLAGVAVPDVLAQRFVPIIKQFGGLGDDEIHLLTKKNLIADLTSLVTVYQPAAIFVFALSWLLPDEVLNLLPNRFINFHFGLLPKYKGADPIFWQIRNGEKNCGLTAHIMTAEVDAGPIVLKQEVPLIPGENHGFNKARLAPLGAEAAVKITGMLNTGDLPLTPMPAEPPLYFKRPTPAQLAINWQAQSATEIACLVNAANPVYGGAITSINQTQINFYEVAPADVNNPGSEYFAPGTVVHADLVYGLIVACINSEFLKINVVSMQQGFFSGSKLFSMGFKTGHLFQ